MNFASPESDEQAEEDAAVEVRLHRLEEQVEWGDGDRRVDVAVEDGRAVDLDPELAHVEVVDGRDQLDQGTAVQRSLPMG